MGSQFGNIHTFFVRGKIGQPPAIRSIWAAVKSPPVRNVGFLVACRCKGVAVVSSTKDGQPQNWTWDSWKLKENWGELWHGSTGLPPQTWMGSRFTAVFGAQGGEGDTGLLVARAVYLGDVQDFPIGLHVRIIALRGGSSLRKTGGPTAPNADRGSKSALSYWTCPGTRPGHDNAISMARECNHGFPSFSLLCGSRPGARRRP